MTKSRLNLKLKKEINGQFSKKYIPWNKNRIGAENSGWKGGISRDYMRKIIKESGRDLTICQICREKSKRIVIHHIDGNINNNILRNLVVLCYFCHHAIHNNPNKREEQFQIGHPKNKHYIEVIQ